MSENVIEFPNRNPDLSGLPITMEDAEARITGVRQYYIDELATVVIENVANQLMTGGFDVLGDSCHKEFALVIESVRALMCATTGLYHPFQDLAAQVMVDALGDGVLTIANEISLKFDDEKAENEPQVEASPEVV